jgi:uncharacterized membrane protein YdjX (TVP38/TMEM64 family)
MPRQITRTDDTRKSPVRMVEQRKAGGENHTKQSDKVQQSKYPLLISGLLIAMLVAAYFLIPSFQEFVRNAYATLSSGDRRQISAWVDNFGFWGPIAIVLCMVAQMFLLIIPSILLMVVAVVAYGPFWGAVIASLSVVVASTVGYFIGRWIGPVTVYRLIGEKKEKKVEQYVEEYGVWAIIAVRATPILSNDAFSFVAGLVKLNYWKFAGATAVGIIPLSALVAIIGKDNDSLKTGMIWLSVVSVIAFIAFLLYKKFSKST